MELLNHLTANAAAHAELASNSKTSGTASSKPDRDKSPSGTRALRGNISVHTKSDKASTSPSDVSTTKLAIDVKNTNTDELPSSREADSKAASNTTRVVHSQPGESSLAKATKPRVPPKVNHAKDQSRQSTSSSSPSSSHSSVANLVICAQPEVHENTTPSCHSEASDNLSSDQQVSSVAASPEPRLSTSAGNGLLPRFRRRPLQGVSPDDAPPVPYASKPGHLPPPPPL